MSQSFVVPAGAAGQRLDVFLAQVTRASRSQVQRWLRQSAVTVNGRVERASYLIVSDDQIQLTPPSDVTQSHAPKVLPDLPVLYEDEEVIVIDKPAGISVHAGAGHTAEATIADWVRPRTADTDVDRPGIVHRLDRDTSGLLVLAKTTPTKHWLQAQWQAGRVAKTYLLLTVGRVTPPEATIDLPLNRDPARPLRRAVVKGGRPAVTHYQTRATYPGYTFIEAHPKTGRTHQLRVHFAAINHPIAGDILYGPPERPAGLSRQFLHASAIRLPLPSGRYLELASPLPADLTSFLSSLTASYNT